jgi:hypothetical protein
MSRTTRRETSTSVGIDKPPGSGPCAAMASATTFFGRGQGEDKTSAIPTLGAVCVIGGGNGGVGLGVVTVGASGAFAGGRSQIWCTRFLRLISSRHRMVGGWLRRRCRRAEKAKVVGVGVSMLEKGLCEIEIDGAISVVASFPIRRWHL